MNQESAVVADQYYRSAMWVSGVGICHSTQFDCDRERCWTYVFIGRPEKGGLVRRPKKGGLAVAPLGRKRLGGSFDGRVSLASRAASSAETVRAAQPVTVGALQGVRSVSGSLGPEPGSRSACTRLL